VTTEQINNINKLDEKQSVTNMIDATDEKTANLLKSQNCHDVTVEIGGTG